MTGLPTIAVYLDDGTETFPYNITPYVSLKSQIEIKRGRSDEFGETDATSVDLTLKNDDGRFSLGSVAYNCQPGQGLKYVETKGTGTYTFYGFVDDWPTAWDGPLGTVSVASITALDAQSLMNRTPIRSMIEAEVRRAFAAPVAAYQAGQAYFPLTEPAGSLAAGDTSGNGHEAMTQQGTGTAVEFAAADGPPWFTDTENTAPIFNVGKYMRTPRRQAYSVNSIGFSAFINSTDSDCSIATIYTTTDVIFLKIDTGTLHVYASNDSYDIFSASDVDDGAWHQVGFARVGSTMYLYIDGVVVGSDAAPIAISSVESIWLGVADPSDSFGFHGSMAHIVVGNQELAPFMDDISAAGLTGFAGDTASQRTDRLAAYGGLSSSSNATTVMAGQQLAGTFLWPLLQQVEDAEGGRLYIDQSGDVALKSRGDGWDTAVGVVALTVAKDSINHGDLIVLGDTQQLFNRGVGTRDTGAQVAYDNQASMTLYGGGNPARGQYEKDLGTLMLTTDDEVLDRCTWIANIYGVVRPRLGTVTINLLTATTAVVQAVLALEVGSRMQITGLPSQSPISTADLIVEGWADSKTARSWSRTFNTSAAILQQVWTLEDPDFGAYDTFPLAY